MRLIDADALIESCLNHCRTEFEIKNCCMSNESVIAIIQDAPTVERPQGEWLHPYKSDIACECSNCHRQMPITDYYHFCPNCGAKMLLDKEVQHGNSDIELQPTQRVSGKDYKMINAMAFIKEYCKDVVDGCSNCPMFDNCVSNNKPFPYFWYIPEV